MTADAGALTTRLHGFVDALRARGLPVSLSERIDAIQAVETVDLGTAALHTALSATLVKNSEHLSAFEEVYHLYFRASGPPASGDDEFDFEEMVRRVLTEGSETLARLLAEQAVARFTELVPGRAAAGIMYERQAVQGIGLDRLTEQVRGELEAGNGGPRTSDPTIHFELDRDQVAERAAMIRAQIRTVVREVMVADRGAEAVNQTIAKPLTSDIVIGRADAEQLREIRRALLPLQRKLATTLMRKRRHRHGPLDVRATVRSSMSTGGVPMRVHYRHPTPTKPDLYVLADLSGSVANFAAFTVSLISGMSDLFSRCRSFAFIADAVEVSDIFRRIDDPSDALRAVTQLEALNFARARTDYGQALARFAAEIGPQLGRRSTVLIFGDGRGNYRPAGEQYLADIAARAGSVHWLNPEPRNLWDGGDSRMPTYEQLCTDAISCRTLNDVRRFIETLD